ncbi:parathyroid hormone/parathyroid hormone-related peptide receptor-like [Gigantopelta aegis]|uniref:parathyroid hormone/parathyroid hormone-related peptide receptor-like n=1 Tax=Gigantopelta aegis TaxID=1735272 RepID=UPI001B88A72B|nr:parathyroid hormone/parathyroid hormone-related peptide receptor-like [Gigantopelta aegis]
MSGVYVNLLVIGMQYLVCRGEIMGQGGPKLTVEYSRFLVFKARKNCLEEQKQTPHPGDGLYCNITFDNLLCWPYTRAGEVATQRCPDYIIGFNTHDFATKKCEDTGLWQYRSDLNSVWTNFKPCYDHDRSGHPSVHPLIEKHIHIIQLLSTIGYSISLGTLLIAVFLMLIFKQLHCHRNTIHINLFMSFILRAIIMLLKDFLVQGVGFDSDNSEGVNGSQFNDVGSHWECKLFFTMFHYALGANYIWIFVEGLYLHTIIFVAVFNQKTIFKFYIAIGWLLPLTFVIPWVFVRIFLQNTLCWNTHEGGYYWIMRGPITASICINFFFFINIIRVLFTKLMATNTRDPRRYRKLAKSTLVLIPLFGVYYILVILIPDQVEPKIYLIRFYIETILNSFQGVMVAFLFCFLNGEVKNEIKKKWRRRQLRRESCTRTSRAFSMTSFAVRDSVSQIQMHDIFRNASSPNFACRGSISSERVHVANNSSPQLNFNGDLHYVDSKIPTNQGEVPAKIPANHTEENDDKANQNGGKLIHGNCKRVELSRVSEESEETSPMLL